MKLLSKPYNIALFILFFLFLSTRCSIQANGQTESDIFTIETPWNILPVDFEMAFLDEKLIFSANMRGILTEDYSVLHDLTFSYTRFLDLGVSGNLKNPHVSQMKSLSDSVVLVGVTQYGGKKQSLSTAFFKITENLIINQFPIGKGIILTDVDDLGDGVFICGQYTDSSLKQDGFFSLLFPLNVSKTSIIYTLKKLHPESIQALSDSTVLLSGSAFDSITNSWNSKSFIGIFNTSGKWDYLKELTTKDEFEIKKVAFENPTGLIHFAGEIQGSQTNKKDIFYGNISPASDTSVQLLVLGGDNFEILEDLIISDSLIFLLGSSEFYGNGIDHPFCSRINRDLSIQSFEVMEPSFRGKAMAGKIRDGKIHVLGYRDNMNENWESFEAIANPIAERIFCNGSAFYPNSFNHQITLFQIQRNVIVDTLSQIDSLIGGPDWPTQRELYCDKAICPDTIAIENFEDPICLGDTLILRSSPTIQGDWYLNENYVATDSMVKIIFKDTGLHELLFTLSDGPCFRQARSRITVNPIPEILLSGPSWICPGTVKSTYSINGFELDTVKINVVGGALLSMDEYNISIKWHTDPGQISIETTNIYGCRDALTQTIRLDSIMDPLPEINFVSWDSDSIFCHIETSNWADLQERKIMWDFSGSWEELESFSEKQEYFFSPLGELKNGLAFQIKAIDHCGIIVPPIIHRSIFLFQKDKKYVSTLAWEPYEGWDISPDYTLVQTGRLFLDSVPFVIENDLIGNKFETDILVEISEEKCYRIKGTDGNWETWSNEVCIEGVAQLFVSNVVTPNGDGKNDVLTARAAFDISNLQWQIFGRSGNLILQFEGKPGNIDFSYLNTGVYYYTAEYQEIGSWQGWFQVIR